MTENLTIYRRVMACLADRFEFVEYVVSHQDQTVEVGYVIELDGIIVIDNMEYGDIEELFRIICNQY